MTKTVNNRSGPRSTNTISRSTIAISRTQASCPTSSTQNNPGLKKHYSKRSRARSASALMVKMLRHKAQGLKKMLAVMSEECSSGGGGEQCRDVTQDFLTTGRVGRRNALPDILGEHARLSTAELPEQMSCLSVSDDPSKNQSTSNSMQQQPSSSHVAAAGSMQPKS